MSGSGRSNRSCVKNIKLQVGSWDSDAARFYSEPFPLATLSGMIMNLATGRLPGLARRQPASSCSTAAAVGDANLNQSESISHTKHVGPANIQAARLSCAAACGKGRTDLSAEHSMRMSVGYGGPAARSQARLPDDGRGGHLDWKQK